MTAPPLPPLPATTLPAARRFIAAGHVLDVATAPDGEFYGRFVSADDEWFVLRLAGGVEAEIPLEDIRRIDRITGRGLEGAVIGAFAGGIPLAVLSWMLGAAINSGTEYYFILFTLGAIPVVGGLAGIGWLVRVALRRREPIFIASSSA